MVLWQDLTGSVWLLQRAGAGAGAGRHSEALQPKWHPVAGHNSIPRSGHPVGSGDMGSAWQGCHKSTQQVWHLLVKHLPSLPPSIHSLSGFPLEDAPATLSGDGAPARSPVIAPSLRARDRGPQADSGNSIPCQSYCFWGRQEFNPG